MKIRDFAGRVLPVPFAALVLLAGCAARNDFQELRNAPHQVYDTPERIKAMPSCKAVVVQRGPCYVQLREPDGNEFLIGSPAAGSEVLQFLPLLKDGQAYRLPEAFHKYQEQHRRVGD